MCGRFVQQVSEQAWLSLQGDLDVSDAPAPAPRYNLAPSQPMAGFVWAPSLQRAEATTLTFGMSGGARGLVINARAETVTERRMFAGLLRGHRALVVASAFYEWAPPPSEGGVKQPHCFAKSDGTPFVFAALVARTGAPAPGAVLLTCEANTAVAPLHGRMPVMLDAPQARRWIDARVPAAEALPLLGPYAGRMRVWPVSRAVNNARHDAPDCIRGLKSEGDGRGYKMGS